MKKQEPLSAKRRRSAASSPRRSPDPTGPAAEGGARQRALQAAGQLLDARQALLNKGLRALTPLPAFEDVLDQRVAAALRRLGFPDAVELARMREQITDLQQRLEALGPVPKGRDRR